MRAKIHDYSNGRLVLSLETESETERGLIDFLFGPNSAEDKKIGISRPNPNVILLESERYLKTK